MRVGIADGKTLDTVKFESWRIVLAFSGIHLVLALFYGLLPYLGQVSDNVVIVPNILNMIFGVRVPYLPSSWPNAVYAIALIVAYFLRNRRYAPRMVIIMVCINVALFLWVYLLLQKTSSFTFGTDLPDLPLLLGGIAARSFIGAGMARLLRDSRLINPTKSIAK